ncbi:Uncharacterised protein [Legionella beliardensis]|uniref:Uncharacterized protein n=1 Tax=Legionella beliardensis TaxID=91822 RepID=A0A378I0A1_9GAMM|nr:hypothetical protein [Legionella beliardensis]STX28402.1 Uncharacterised protein [Legionella beliardensis]
MTIHVFIGAGPANLHRALKVRKLEPDAEIIIIDNRLKSDGNINRENGRANIFRFETEDVTDKLIADGVDKNYLLSFMHQRDFSVAQGFQQGDDNVFSSKPFSQIQIRDLQHALIETLKEKGKLYLVSEDFNTSSLKILRKQVSNYLKINGFVDNDVHIHVATGALRGDKKDEIIYPDKATHHLKHTTDDVAAMPVVPVHGTVTFFIKNKHDKPIITCDELQANQRSLDLTDWQEPLKQFGWNLVRPPRIRVFYANDILYIGTEIPMSMMNNEDAADYEEKVAEYTRQIAQLVFPDLKERIENLEANKVLRSRFPTGRGEAGQVIIATKTIINEQKVNISLFNNGDSRYLPHYQTGSGFVTGFLQNELYADIYQHQSLEALVQWAQVSGHLEPGQTAEHVREEYKKWIQPSDEQDSQDADEQAILRAFQQELYIYLSREIIEENKAKVGRYFNALHKQILNLLPQHFAEFFTYFDESLPNKSLINPLSIELLHTSDKHVAVLAMLKTGNTSFLRSALPRLLNMDFSRIDDSQLGHLRNVLLEDLERNLQEELLEQFENLLEQLKNLSVELKQIDDLNTEPQLVAIEPVTEPWWVKHQNKLKAAAIVSLTVIGGFLGTFLIPIPGLGSMLGGAVGGAIGAGTGLSLGLTGTGLLELFKKKPALGTALTTVGSTGLGAGIGAILGTFAFPGIGTAIGAAIGAGVSASTSLFATGIYNAVTNHPIFGALMTTIGSTGLGAGAGALIGTLLFPGPGTAIGAVIGAGIGAGATLITTGLVKLIQKFKQPTTVDMNPIPNNPPMDHSPQDSEDHNQVLKGMIADLGVDPQNNSERHEFVQPQPSAHSMPTSLSAHLMGTEEEPKAQQPVIQYSLSPQG